MSFLRSFTAPAATGRILRAPQTVREGESALPPIVLIYEDMTAALRAVSQLFQLRRRLPHGIDQRLATWNFSMLAQAHLQDLIRADGRHANLIVVASSGAASALPAHVTTWLRESLRDRDETRPCLLVPLLHQTGGTGEPDTRLRQLQQLATETGASLLTTETSAELRAVA